MAFTLYYTPQVRKALEMPRKIGTDLFVIVAIAGFFCALAMMFGQMGAPMNHMVEINLSVWSLPKYTLLSLSRAFAAYAISLGFTLVYGSIAAHNHRAEKVMLPALDILQSIPVLGFMPGIVLAMVHLFPTRELGLELACIIMIFTAQVWNMTFSYVGSVRSIPPALNEAATIQHLSAWQRFRILELPASMIGLVWNSMMSMAGGWFVITVEEAFTLNGHNFELPGLGSYMVEAINARNVHAQIAAVIAVILMIVAVDQLFWRPIVAWSERYKLEDVSAAEAPQSWVLDLLSRSLVLRLFQRIGGVIRKSRLRPKPKIHPHQAPPQPAFSIAPLINWTIVLALGMASLFGLYRLIQLMLAVPLHDAPDNGPKGWLTVLGALVFSFLRVTAAELIGVVWALPAGILIGLSPRWSQRLQPIVQIAASFPSPLIFPWIAFGLLFLHVPFTLGCVVLMLLGSQWYILFNVIAGAMAIPSELREAGRVYHLSTWKCWTTLYIPAVFPYLVTGLITAAGGAWNATIVCELLPLGTGERSVTFSAFGLGWLIDHASGDGDGNSALLAASVVTMALFVVLLNRVFWKRLYRLAEARYSLAT